MAISFVSSHSATGGSSTASIAVPAAATAGRVGLLTVSTSGTGAYTPPAGWSLVAAQPWWFDSRDSRLYVRVFGVGESGSYSVGVPYSYWAVGLAIFDGVDTTTPIEAVGPDNAYGTSHATGSVTVAGADRWLVGVWAGSDSQQVLSLPGTMTSRLSVAGGNTGQRLVIGSEAAGAGTYTRTGTTGSADDYAAYLVVLSPAAGSGGPVALAGALTGTGDLAGALAVTGGGVAALSGTLAGAGSLAATLSVSGGGSVALSGALAATGALAAELTVATGGVWHYTEAERPTLDRYQNTTIAATGGQAYLGVSSDGVTYTWFSGPLQSDGRTLTQVASEAAAKAAAIALPANGRWQLPNPIDARLIRLGHRSTGTSYALREFYPRRLVEADDIRAEAISTLHLGAAAVTADKIAAQAITAGKIAAGAIDAMTITGATIRTAASGARAELTAAGLRTYDAAGNVVIEASTATNGAIWAGGGRIRLNRNQGIEHVPPDNSIRTPFDFYQADGVTLIGSIGAGVSGGGANTINLTANNGMLNLNAQTIYMSSPSVVGEGTFSTAGQIFSTGAGAGYTFSDRTYTNIAWVWYADADLARLWRSGVGDRLTVDANGSISAYGNAAVGGLGGFNGAGLNAGVALQAKAIPGLVAIRALDSSGNAFFDLWDGGRMALNGYFDAAEIGDPGAPVANVGRIYFRDSAGKTQLCVRFATGAVIVLATQP